MRRFAVVAVIMIALGGCALPPPVTVASWALDGISLLTTEKTLTDHGLSAVSGKDCALWRGLTEGNVCRDERGNILIAAHRRPTLIRAPVEMAALAPSLDGPYLNVR